MPLRFQSEISIDNAQNPGSSGSAGRKRGPSGREDQVSVTSLERAFGFVSST